MQRPLQFVAVVGRLPVSPISAVCVGPLAAKQRIQDRIFERVPEKKVIIRGYEEG